MNNKTVYITRNKLFKNISMILLNNITEIDEYFIENNFELFYTDCKNCEGTGEKDGLPCEECYGEGRFDNEFYQYFITNADEYDCERLKKFGVDIGYSEKLNNYIICIGDFGTSWSAFSYSKEESEDYELRPDETLNRETIY
jgi:hypothetical protein